MFDLKEHAHIKRAVQQLVYLIRQNEWQQHFKASKNYSLEICHFCCGSFKYSFSQPDINFVLTFERRKTSSSLQA